jgi:hypothetical protein
MSAFGVLSAWPDARFAPRGIAAGCISMNPIFAIVLAAAVRKLEKVCTETVTGMGHEI